MGYILPINHEQYTQYANRVVRKDGRPMKVKRVQKITIHGKLKGKTDYEDTYKEVKSIRKYVFKNKNTANEIDHSPRTNENAEMTGKGQYFDESV